MISNFISKIRERIGYIVLWAVIFAIIEIINFLAISPIVNWLLPENEFILTLLPFVFPLVFSAIVVDMIWKRLFQKEENKFEESDED